MVAADVGLGVVEGVVVELGVEVVFVLMGTLEFAEAAQLLYVFGGEKLALEGVVDLLQHLFVHPQLLDGSCLLPAFLSELLIDLLDVVGPHHGHPVVFDESFGLRLPAGEG